MSLSFRRADVALKGKEVLADGVRVKNVEQRGVIYDDVLMSLWLIDDAYIVKV